MAFIVLKIFGEYFYVKFFNVLNYFKVAFYILFVYNFNCVDNMFLIHRIVP